MIGGIKAVYPPCLFGHAEPCFTGHFEVSSVAENAEYTADSTRFISVSTADAAWVLVLLVEYCFTCVINQEDLIFGNSTWVSLSFPWGLTCPMLCFKY